MASPAVSFEDEGQVPLRDQDSEATLTSVKDTAMCYCGDGNGGSSEEPTKFACGIARGVVTKVGNTQYVWILLFALRDILL